MKNPMKRKAVGNDDNEVSEQPKKGKRKDFYGDNYSYLMFIFI